MHDSLVPWSACPLQSCTSFPVPRKPKALLLLPCSYPIGRADRHAIRQVGDEVGSRSTALDDPSPLPCRITLRFLLAVMYTPTSPMSERCVLSKGAKALQASQSVTRCPSHHETNKGVASASPAARGRSWSKQGYFPDVNGRPTSDGAYWLTCNRRNEPVPACKPRKQHEIGMVLHGSVNTDLYLRL
jgi:hypothetical protein